MGRASIRTKTTRPTSALSSTTPPSTSTFTSTTATPRNLKKAARKTRHTTFVSRIEKTSTKSAISNAARSRRRAKVANSEKLAAGLESLIDALPTNSEINDSVDFTSQSSKAVGVGAAGANMGASGVGLGAKKGVRSRPGAMKKKERLVRSECERFGKNLAIISATAQQAQTHKEEEEEKEKVEGRKKPTAVGNTWAMLRGFIGATMEKKEEFVEKEKQKGIEKEKEKEGEMQIE